jgi:hypothetical protein
MVRLPVIQSGDKCGVDMARIAVDMIHMTGGAMTDSA